MQKKPSTSVDVARLASVSQATVSVVLNDKSSNIRVSEATRQRVLDAAAQLNYSPNPVARALRRKRNSIIAYIPRSHRALPGERPGPYLLNAHIARFAMQRGYHAIEMSTEDDSTPDELLQSLLDRRVDGVIFHKPDDPAKVRKIVEYGLPIVQLMRPQFEIETSTVTVDMHKGLTDAVNHLVDLGHRNIAFLDHDDALGVPGSRDELFQAALAKRGLEVSPEYVRRLSGDMLEQASRETRSVLMLSPRPTAIFSASGGITLGVLRTLYDEEVRVPDAVSVLSLDDIFAPLVYPPVTYVNPTLERAAEVAVELLLTQVEDDSDTEFAPRHIELPTELIVQRSTRPPPQHAT